MLGHFRTIDEGDLHVDDGLADDEEEVVEEELEDDRHFRTGIDPESSLAKARTKFGQIRDS